MSQAHQPLECLPTQWHRLKRVPRLVAAPAATLQAYHMTNKTPVHNSVRSFSVHSHPQPPRHDNRHDINPPRLPFGMCSPQHPSKTPKPPCNLLQIRVCSSLCSDPTAACHPQHSACNPQLKRNQKAHVFIHHNMFIDITSSVDNACSGSSSVEKQLTATLVAVSSDCWLGMPLACACCCCCGQSTSQSFICSCRIG